MELLHKAEHSDAVKSTPTQFLCASKTGRFLWRTAATTAHRETHGVCEITKLFESTVSAEHLKEDVQKLAEVLQDIGKRQETT